MSEVEEMNSPTHMKTVTAKLFYKFRERWRTVAYDYYEHSGKRAKFKQLVDFVERQANMDCDPLFGHK